MQRKGTSENAQGCAQDQAGSQKADLFPAPDKAVFSLDNYLLWADYAVGCTRLVAQSVHGDAATTVRAEIDRFKRILDRESTKGRGHFINYLMSAFAHADLSNAAAMLPLMRYLEQKYQLCEDGFKERKEG